jgi:hypothetical protein
MRKASGEAPVWNSRMMKSRLIMAVKFFQHSGMAELVKLNVIENKIYFIRGKKVMLDRDLAALYEVETKVLNQAVKRNHFVIPFIDHLSLAAHPKKGYITVMASYSVLVKKTVQKNVRKLPASVQDRFEALVVALRDGGPS